MGASRRTLGLYKETSPCFFSSWMVFVALPPPCKPWVTQMQITNSAIWLDIALPLNFEATELSSLEIAPEIEQKGHYYVNESAKQIQ